MKNMENPGKQKAAALQYQLYFCSFLSSITQTYLIEDPGNQGSTLRLVINDIHVYICIYIYIDGWLSAHGIWG